MSRSKLVLPLFGLGLLALLLTGLWSRWVDAPLLGGLREANVAYLETNRESALKNFLVLSALKSGLDIVEGSTLGVSLGASLQLEAGDVVQSAYDIVNLSWYTVLAGMIAMTLLQWAQEAAVTLQIPLAVFTAALCVGLPFRPMRLRPLFLLSLTLWLAFAVCLPLALRGAEALSARITADARTEATEGFAQSREQLFPEESTSPPKSVRERLEALREQIEDLGDKLIDQMDALVSRTVRLVAVYLLDCIVFPLLCFLLPLALIRKLLSHQRTLGRDRRLGTEIARQLTPSRDESRNAGA